MMQVFCNNCRWWPYTKIIQIMKISEKQDRLIYEYNHTERIKITLLIEASDLIW